MYNRSQMKRFAAVAAAIAACAPAMAQDTPRRPVAVLQEACTACHGLNRLETEKTRDEWEYTVHNMIGRGANVKPAEIKGLVAYLGRYFGMSVNINKASAEEIQAELEIPVEDVRAIVEARRKSELRDWADLAKIQGLNIKKIEPVKDRIRFY